MIRKRLELPGPRNRMLVRGAGRSENSMRGTIRVSNRGIAAAICVFIPVGSERYNAM